VYVQGKPQEHVARAILLAFLQERGFAEVPIRGGKVDVLLLSRDATFVLELKIWRGVQYYSDGIAELREYVANNSIPDLAAAMYIVLDPTATGRARQHVESSPRQEDIDIVVVNINPQAPSQKGAQKRLEEG